MSVKVKPLQWAPESGLGFHRAQSVSGEYIVCEDMDHSDRFIWWRGDMVRGAELKSLSLETAKAAAQADYETRILSALEISE